MAAATSMTAQEKDVRMTQTSPSWMTFVKRSFAFWTGLFLLAFGGIFLAIGWTFLHRESQYQLDGQLADGIVLTKAIERATRSSSSGRRTETHYNVGYRFKTLDGRLYEGEQDVSVSTWDGLREQEPVRVQYVASSPTTNRIASERATGSGYVFAGVGMITALVGATLLGRSAMSAHHKVRIWSQGTSADAIVAAVEETNFKVNRRPMWVVRYRYRDHSARTHDGTSDYMTAEKANNWKIGDTIRVRFDPHKPNASVWVE